MCLTLLGGSRPSRTILTFGKKKFLGRHVDPDVGVVGVLAVVRLHDQVVLPDPLGAEVVVELLRHPDDARLALDGERLVQVAVLDAEAADGGLLVRVGRAHLDHLVAHSGVLTDLAVYSGWTK